LDKIANKFIAQPLAQLNAKNAGIERAEDARGRLHDKGFDRL
jgi:hypothetical protein